MEIIPLQPEGCNYYKYNDGSTTTAVVATTLEDIKIMLRKKIKLLLS